MPTERAVTVIPLHKLPCLRPSATLPAVPKPRLALVGGLFLVAALLLGLHCRVYSLQPPFADGVRGIGETLSRALHTPARFVTDDAYISFVYSKNLAEHGELVFNLGERVEGYTNFLWTVLLAGLMKLGWRPESSSVWLGLAFAMATMLLGGYLLRALRRQDETEPVWSCWDALPALLLALVPGYACWASGGLETQMFTFFVTLGATLYLTQPTLRPASALAFGLAALTRPEGMLFFALTAAHYAIGRLRRRENPFERAAWIWAGCFLLLVLPHLFWRRAYYGYWLPNTFYVKSSGGAGVWRYGLRYVGRYLGDFLLPLLLVPPFISALTRRASKPAKAMENRSERRLGGYLLLVLPVFWLYVASVGGDFMGLYRFALPVVPLIAVAFALSLRTLSAPLAARHRLVPAGLVAVLLAGYCVHDLPVVREALRTEATVDRGIIDPPGYLRWYTDDRAAIGRWFGQYAKPDDYAVVGGAGAQVYYSGIPSLDCFGLSDAYIAHHVRANNSRPGHEKYAPLDYQLARRPTIVTSNYYVIAGAPVVRPDAAAWRKRGYRYVSVEVPGLSARWYSFLLRNDRGMGPIRPVADPAAPLDDELQ